MLAEPCLRLVQVGLGLVLHEADNVFDTGGLPLDDIVAIALLLFFGIRTLQVCCAGHPVFGAHVGVDAVRAPYGRP